MTKYHFGGIFSFMTSSGHIEVSDNFTSLEPADDGTGYGGSRALFREAAIQLGVDLNPQEDYTLPIR